MPGSLEVHRLRCAKAAFGQTFSSRCQTARGRLQRSRREFISIADACDVWRPTLKFGGARRDRTDDLMLAKHALSQLSYGPGKGWWARVELNYRPHAYQACALTT